MIAWIVNSRTQSIRIPHQKNWSEFRTKSTIRQIHQSPSCQFRRGGPGYQVQVWRGCRKHANKNIAAIQEATNTLFNQSKTLPHKFTLCWTPLSTGFQKRVFWGYFMINMEFQKRFLDKACKKTFFEWCNVWRTSYTCNNCLPCLVLLRQTHVSVWS